jgi:hypothetical protein
MVKSAIKMVFSLAFVVQWTFSLFLLVYIIYWRLLDVCVAESLLLCVLLCILLFILCPFSPDHCDVYLSSTYGFWLPLWHLERREPHKTGDELECSTSTSILLICNWKPLRRYCCANINLGACIQFLIAAITLLII